MIFDLSGPIGLRIGGWENPSVRLDIRRFAISYGFPRWLSMISCLKNICLSSHGKEEVMEMLRKEVPWQYFPNKTHEK